MKAMTITVIVIVALVLATGLWYTQTYRASPSSNPAPTTTMPTATATSTPAITTPTTIPLASTVTTNLKLKRVDTTPGTGHWVLLINGTVTNDSPNPAYDAGLHVFSSADPVLYIYEETIEVTVPVA